MAKLILILLAPGIVLGIVFAIFPGLIGAGSGEVDDADEEECPYCGSGDYDGNHCYTCGKDC